MSQNIEIERRLAAVLAADVAGFSRLTEADEVGTMRMLAAQRAILDNAIARHRGRIANTAGDSVLAEFPSAVNAVQCAVEAQQALRDAAEGVPADRRLLFRIGIHVGDVMVRGGDLLGTGVNVAARLEALADAGGIVLSAAAHEQVKKILPLAYTDLGPQNVKNIEEPVRAFAIGGRAGATTVFMPGDGKPLPLPDKPSIAVLPFQNMSGDPEQEYFADGIVEDIITALSRFKSLFVIARNSSFTYKGRAVDIKQVGRELGVRYVLEGSVRKAGGRLRITGQLIEAATNNHLWADRYDGALEDIFDLQDRVTSNVVGAVSPRLLQVEMELSGKKPTSSLNAYDFYLRGLKHFRIGGARNYEIALEHFRRAIALDPAYAAAFALAARTFSRRVDDGVIEDTAEAIRQGEVYVRKAIEFGQDDAVALAHAGLFVAVALRDPETGRNLLNLAIALNPNLVECWNSSAWTSLLLGEHSTAIEQLERSIRLSPIDPLIFNPETGMAYAYFFLHDFESALRWSGRALTRRPRAVHTLRVACWANALNGQVEKAKAMWAEFPGILRYRSIAEMKERPAYRRKEDVELYCEAARRIGLPE